MRQIKRPNCPNLKALTSDFKYPENKKVLADASFGKCMYCESKIMHVYFGDIEHMKPKEKSPTLKFEWTYLGFACAKCNSAKGDKYDNATPYINPYEEDPEDFVLALGAFLKNKQGSERGDLTIKDIELNRPELLEKRQTTIESIEKAINACMRTKNKSLKEVALEALIPECNKDKEYSLFIKTLFQLHELI